MDDVLLLIASTLLSHAPCPTSLLAFVKLQATHRAVWLRYKSDKLLWETGLVVLDGSQSSWIRDWWSSSSVTGAGRVPSRLKIVASSRSARAVPRLCIVGCCGGPLAFIMPLPFVSGGLCGREGSAAFPRRQKGSQAVVGAEGYFLQFLAVLHFCWGVAVFVI